MPKRPRSFDGRPPGCYLDGPIQEEPDEEIQELIRRMRTDPDAARPKLLPYTRNEDLIMKGHEHGPNPSRDWRFRTKTEIDNEDWRVLPPGKATADFFDYLKGLIPEGDELRHRQLEAVMRAFALRYSILR